jgi:hypothetical protein
LARGLRGLRIDARLLQAAKVFRLVAGVDNMDRFLAEIEALAYERQHDVVLFFVAAEKGTHVSGVVNNGIGQCKTAIESEHQPLLCNGH